MDKQNANGFHPKASVNGDTRRPVPYSVETPYGFHLDLDFLKYVDDIEKGNTIKRVHIQRRNRGPKFSTLPRNFSVPGYGYGYGYGYRPSPKDTWASTPTLGPLAKSHLPEVLEFEACDSVPLGVPGSHEVSYATLRAMEDASIKAFDEQPLGVHVRPYLLRATSMPVTALQRRSSEASDDRTAPAPGGPYWENGSAEDVFVEGRGGPPPGGPSMHLQLAAALRRIGELEVQARTVAELRAQICALREDKERLVLRLHPCSAPAARQGGLCTEGQGLDGQAASSLSLVEGSVRDASGDGQVLASQPTSVDADALSVAALEEKITDLQQKLCRSSEELEESTALLKELTQNNKLKDNRIKQLTGRVRIEPGTNQDSDHTQAYDLECKDSSNEGAPTHRAAAVPSSTDALGKDLTSLGTQTDIIATATTGALAAEKFPEAPPTACELAIGGNSLETQGCDTAGENPEQQRGQGEPQRQPDALELDRTAADSAVGLIARIQGLLREQWECMSSGDPDHALQQPGSKVSSIQDQLLSSIHTLSTLCSLSTKMGGATHQAALKSIMKKGDSAERLGVGGAKKNLKFVGVNGGYETTSSEESSDEECAEVEGQEDSVAPVGDGEADAVEPDPGPDPCERPQEDPPGRELVDEDFTAACLFLKDRLEEVASPNHEMRQMLTALYRVWFRVSSQKDSTAETVALYLAQVRDSVPTMLHFLVNLADGNDNTALQYSVSHSNFTIAKLLLDTGLCEVDHRNKAGYTAAMLASLIAADDAWQLLEHGDINDTASNRKCP
ncbi:hypothetical protein AAFF_G00239430 [Aldrovandia affinis]|uniref:Uncharacterized protein n=1 Tax=Aldrovandia affinis TaxID=143900 RepID=A0AAD7RGS2_9TELE|nr:hypothetical protein AAFF_G00239430 [Aldrovandia affinis]